MVRHRLLRSVQLPDYQATAELYQHPTGAQHLHLRRPDQNLAFGVAFKTLPSDSTGVAHILEHITLSGSRRYPVKSPFFAMLPRSLATFMNAFELIPSGSGWTEQVIHSFTGSDGAGPYAPLIQMGGNLYGTTYRGGANSSASGSDGTAFELIPSGSGWNEKVIYNFAGGAADGANPQASLIPGSNGDLYGTTYRGGTSGVGTVFKIVP